MALLRNFDELDRIGKAAGWRKCGETKVNKLTILEVCPKD